MSGPWLCAHLYEHYSFTRDREFLRTYAYPLMKGSAEFCLAWLIEDGIGRLTTCPSESTENDFLAPDGKPAMTSAGCTMDMALIRELFTNCIHAAKELRIDEEFAAKLDAARGRLIPYQVGSTASCRSGRSILRRARPASDTCRTCIRCIQAVRLHRADTPNLAKAARVSLERRLAQRRGVHRLEPRLGHRVLVKTWRRRQGVGVTQHVDAAQHEFEPV